MIAERRDLTKQREIDRLFVQWHFFTPFFAGILGLLAAFVFLFFSSMNYLFDFYKQRQTRETSATLQDVMAKRQQYLRGYLSFMKDDADFKNAFYYASDDMMSLKKPLAAYLRKYKPLLGVDSVEAVTTSGKVIYSERAARAKRASRPPPLKQRQLPADELSADLVLIDGTPHMAAVIPVRLFDKLAGHLLVGFDLGLPFLRDLRGITRHEFFLLGPDGGMAVSTIQDDRFRRAILEAMRGRKSLPVELDTAGQKYFVFTLPLLDAERKPLTDLYVVGNISELESLRKRIIQYAILLFVGIGTASFYFSYLSSRVLSRKVNLLLAQMKDYRTKVEQQRKFSALGELAAQIAHDVRSPLAALDLVIKDVSQFPEEKRIIVRGAVGRIRDIANSLIEKNREAKAFIEGAAPTAAAPAFFEPISVELLSSHIDPLITEKRLQFRSKIGVEIEARLEAAYGLFARIQPIEFKRVLSNLVNNSVEAMGDKGAVTVYLATEDDNILLKVQDNAKGIPPEILVRLGQRGETHGKAGGSGLGLYHARTSVESWSGGLAIESQVGQGTTVIIKIPKAQSPEWFVSRLELRPGGTIVVLDDDASIHQIWQGRFDSNNVGEQGIEVLHFSTPTELRGFVRESQAKAQDALYLTDYEFIGHQETGLGLLEELGIGEHSILITSRFEEKNILSECQRLRVRMIPKGLAGFVPIEIKAPQPRATAGPDAVLLDDDALVHMTWRISAKSKGLTLVGFRTAKELLAVVEQYPKATAVYLDSELGDEMRGEAIAKDLHAKGFTNLYLATGHAAETLQAMPWIKQVVGKEPPWEA